MRKILYLLINLFLLGLAGLFSSQMLLGFVLAQFLLGILLFLLISYLKKKAVVQQAWNQTIMESGEELILPFQVQIQGPFSPGFYRLNLSIQYNHGPLKSTKIDVLASSWPKLTLQGCGLVTITLHSVHLYDWTGLFYRKLHGLKKVCQIALLPKDIPIYISTAQEYVQGQGAQNLMTSFMEGENAFEVKDIREYQNQDSLRHIHWIQSARMETLYVKEYEKEIQGALSVHALMNHHDPQQKEKDLQFLYSVLFGFLQQQFSITCLFSQDENTWLFSIQDQNDLKKMFTDLILESPSDTPVTEPMQADITILGDQKILNAQQDPLPLK